MVALNIGSVALDTRATEFSKDPQYPVYGLASSMVQTSSMTNL